MIAETEIMQEWSWSVSTYLVSQYLNKKKKQELALQACGKWKTRKTIKM